MLRLQTRVPGFEKSKLHSNRLSAVSTRSLICNVSSLVSIFSFLRGEDGNGKSAPIKRGPGRPPKRKYFGASSKGDKSSPGGTADEDKEGSEHLPASGGQSPELNAAASESESLVSKESEPPKKKKKRPKQRNSAEQEGRERDTPTLGINPGELAVRRMVAA